MRLILIFATIFTFSCNALAERPYFEIQRLGSIQIPEASGYVPQMNIFEYKESSLNPVKVISDMKSFCEAAGERGGDPDNTIFNLLVIENGYIKVFCSINVPVMVN